MKLPIPTLQTTKENFINHARVYPSFDEKLVNDFFENDAVLLQEKLLEYDELMQSSYLERIWTKSYLDTRPPLAIASNFCFKLPHQYDLNDFIFTFAKLFKAYDNNELEFKTPRGDEIFKRQFDILKGGCRIPKTPSDDFSLSFKKPDYISILYKNNLYKASILKDDICGIEFNFDEEQADISLAHLSFCDSDEAAKLYKKYESYNPFFEIIENSRLNICIVDMPFDTFNEEQKYMLYQAPCYHYKTLNFIYNKATKNIFINGEHSFLDGGTISYTLERVYKNLSSPTKFVKPILVKQYIDDEYKNAIKSALSRYTNLSDNLNLTCVLDESKAKEFSKDFIMQTAIVYASKKAYGKYVCQYEAVDVREYDYGRTECVRAVSVELDKALQSFNKEDLLLANTEHKNRIKACKKASGIDRHLLGLFNLIPCIKDKYASKFFESSIYKDTCSTIISTSSLGKNDWVDVFYFHPVHSDGFGISYGNVGNNYYFTCTYFDKKKADIFKKGIQEFFNKFPKN